MKKHQSSEEIFNNYRKDCAPPETFDAITGNYFMPCEYHQNLTLYMRANGFDESNQGYSYYLASMVYARYLQKKYYPLHTEMMKLKKISCLSYKNECRRKTKEFIKEGKIKLDKEFCKICGLPPGYSGQKGKLHIHHLDYLNPEKIIVLCAKCHAQLHNGKPKIADGLGLSAAYFLS